MSEENKPSEDLNESKNPGNEQAQAAEQPQSTPEPSSAAQPQDAAQEQEAGAGNVADNKGTAREERQGGRGRGGRDQQKRRPFKKPEREESEFIEKVLSIKRVTKVTKGGKKMSFSALVVVGDGKGNVGYSLAKAGEVATAIRKSINAAKKNMVRISMKGTTIPHEIIGVCGGAEVLLKPAGEGTGVIAAGPVRAVCDGAGIHNILTKCHRSNNPINVVKATMDGLARLKSSSVVSRRDEAKEETQETAHASA